MRSVIFCCRIFGKRSKIKVKMAKIGVKFQVFTDAKRGGRNYMEDFICVKFQRSETATKLNNDGDAYFGVFDGHGGPEAAQFAKEHLYEEITKQKGFFSDDDAEVTNAIKDGFISAHKLMWNSVDLWPKTPGGLPSTAGTTASVVFVRNGKIFVAHVGDSAIVIGAKEKHTEAWFARNATKDHKPDAPEEKRRIESMGGQVLSKAGIARVVWKRPRILKGPVRRSTVIDHVPFLAVARSLGDLWSYNSEKDVFVVSPEPDIAVYKLDPIAHRCIILGSDGVWNMVKPDEAIRLVSTWVNNKKNNCEKSHPASILVQLALERWNLRQIRADNTSAIVVLINPSPSCSSADNNEFIIEIDNNSDRRPLSFNSSLLPLHQNLNTVFSNRNPGVLFYGKGIIRNRSSKEDCILIKRKPGTSLTAVRSRRLSDSIVNNEVYFPLDARHNNVSGLLPRMRSIFCTDHGNKMEKEDDQEVPQSISSEICWKNNSKDARQQLEKKSRTSLDPCVIIAKLQSSTSAFERMRSFDNRSHLYDETASVHSRHPTDNQKNITIPSSSDDHLHTRCSPDKNQVMMSSGSLKKVSFSGKRKSYPTLQSTDNKRFRRVSFYLSSYSAHRTRFSCRQRTLLIA